jgi:hypothetical protein
MKKEQKKREGKENKEREMKKDKKKRVFIFLIFNFCSSLYNLSFYNFFDLVFSMFSPEYLHFPPNCKLTFFLKSCKNAELSTILVVHEHLLHIFHILHSNTINPYYNSH